MNVLKNIKFCKIVKHIRLKRNCKFYWVIPQSIKHFFHIFFQHIFSLLLSFSANKMPQMYASLQTCCFVMLQWLQMKKKSMESNNFIHNSPIMKWLHGSNNMLENLMMIRLKHKWIWRPHEFGLNNLHF